jgi:hypothetical protein
VGTKARSIKRRVPHNAGKARSGTYAERRGLNRILTKACYGRRDGYRGLVRRGGRDVRTAVDTGRPGRGGALLRLVSKDLDHLLDGARAHPTANLREKEMGIVQVLAAVQVRVTGQVMVAPTRPGASEEEAWRAGPRPILNDVLPEFNEVLTYGCHAGATIERR